MRNYLIACLLLVSCGLHAQSSQPEDNIIPAPVSVTKQSGEFILKDNAVIGVPGMDKEIWKVAQYLSQAITAPTGYEAEVQSNATQAPIQLSLLASNDATLGTEGYKLTVTPAGINITANQPAGLFYGVQTLLQLLPKEIESKTQVSNVTWRVPAVEITDYPRFGWRGLMFDVARHFFSKEDVKKYIDEMVRYKFNVLHMHLTDDEGWRVEIKSLPNLTKVGAWNVKKEGYFGGFSKPTPDEPRDFGGFYTQDDIRELVQYAKDRFVNILPEVDVPGHSLAAIASYPELACSAGTGPKPEVSSGQSIKDWSKHVALVDDNLCPSNEKVYVFLDKVITELAQLFPFDYIHMGGDETFKTFWENSPDIKALMKRENLKTMEEVQSYFTKRVEKIVLSKGKKFMGWDEILEGGISPNATVMSWRGMKGGIQAAKMKHDVVMTPTDFAYIDYMQGDAAIEPRIYATLRLNKVYSFDPLPEGVDAKYILGGQANLWTEQVYNLRHAQYMTWPRALAISEDVWSQKDKKNWNNFVTRVEDQFKRFDAAEVKYAPSLYDPIINVTKDGNTAKIALSTEIEGLDIYYTFDNSFPDRFYPKYTQPLTPPKDAVQLKIITYKGNEPVGRLITLTKEDWQKRAGIK